MKTQVLPEPPCTCACHATRGVKHARPCCTKAPLGAETENIFYMAWNQDDHPGFVSYELQRRENGMSWNPVVSIGKRDHTEFTDREVPRGWQATYRVRSLRADGPGPWVMLQTELIG